MRYLAVYLAGGIDKDSPWRKEVLNASKDCPIIFYTPDEDLLYTTQGMAQAHRHDDSFDELDLMKVEECDVTFAYFGKKSKSRFSGTTYECSHAKSHGKRVIAVCDMPKSKAHFYELVLRQATRRYETLEDGIEKLKEWSSSFQPVGEEE